MAVFTTLEYNDITAFIAPYGLGELLSFEGISAGMENTNYFLSTSSHHLANETAAKQAGQYILTVFEELPDAHLPFHITLIDTLYAQGLPVASVLRDYDGNAIQQLKGKPALLSVRLPGNHPPCTHQAQCAAIGTALARFHLVTHLTVNTHNRHLGIRSFQWLKDCAHRASKLLSTEDQQLVQTVMEEYTNMVEQDLLPKGIIHGDLFRDNALFEGNTLTGIIDFYNAGEGYFMADLAIVVNDWCVNDSIIDPIRYQALLEAYASIRPFSEIEKQSWPLLLEVCAMRFWLSRLLSQQQFSDAHELMLQKNPEAFRQLLLQHRQQSYSLI